MVILLIFSLFIQNIVGFLKFKNWVNPITMFSIIHFFHNCSFSFSYWLNNDLYWRADPNVSYNTINNVLNINILGSWVFFLIVIFFAKERHYIKSYRIKNYNFFLNGYYIISLAFFIRSIFLLRGNFVYGANQAATSIESFDPLSRIFYLRVIFICLYLILSKVDKKNIIRIVLIEIVLSLFLGERKDLILIIFSFIIPRLNKIKIKISFKKSLAFVFGIFFLSLIPIFRSLNSSISILQRLEMSLAIMNEFKDKLIFSIFNLSNSEGVQNWTYQLVENNQIQLLYGKSYLQAIINMFWLRPFQSEEIVNWQAAYHFKNIAYPETTNHGWDYTFTAEAIMNFGNDFAFLSYMFLGLIVVYLYKRKSKNDFFKLNYLFLWPMLMISFRTDSTSMLRIFSYVVIIFIWLKISKRIKYSRVIN